MQQRQLQCIVSTVDTVEGRKICRSREKTQDSQDRPTHHGKPFWNHPTLLHFAYQMLSLFMCSLLEVCPWITSWLKLHSTACNRGMSQSPCYETSLGRVAQQQPSKPFCVVAVTPRKMPYCVVDSRSWGRFETP